MTILNHYQITESISTSGQPTEDQFSDIASAGYDVVINLAMPAHKNSIDTEGSIVTSLGMTYIHIPVPFEAPTVDHLQRFTGYMNVLRDKNVWVHCMVNARVSAFLYCYLQREQGLTAEQSTSPILTAWLPTMDDVWKEFIASE